MTASEIAARRAAAVRAFWSDDPLNLHYRRETGRETFALKSLIAFVVELPRAEFEQLTQLKHG